MLKDLQWQQNGEVIEGHNADVAIQEVRPCADSAQPDIERLKEGYNDYELAFASTAQIWHKNKIWSILYHLWGFDEMPTDGVSRGSYQ